MPSPAVLLAGSIVASTSGPANTQRKVKVSSDPTKVSAALTGFPALLTRANLPDEMFDPSGSNSAQADGGDVRVSSDETGTALLPIEVVEFSLDSATGASDGACEIWVKTDLDGSAATDLWVWYASDTGAETQPAESDPTGKWAVWSDFEWVHHMDTLSVLDATQNQLHATSVSPDLSIATGGKTPTALDMGDKTVDTRIELPMSGVDFNAAVGFSAWVKPDDVNGRIYHAEATDPDNNDMWLIEINSSGQLLFAFDTGRDPTQVVGSADLRGAWHNFVGIRTGGNSASLYIDGVFVGSNSISSSVSGINSISAHRYGEDVDGATNQYSGLLDEFRKYTFQPSADWISTEYANQNDPAAFWTTGTAEYAVAQTVSGGRAFEDDTQRTFEDGTVRLFEDQTGGGTDTTGQIAYEDDVVMTFEDGTAILWEDTNVSDGGGGDTGGGDPQPTAVFGGIFVIVTL